MKLSLVDFKLTAAEGCYVYCYLRATGAPYYVGIASNARRPFGPHSCGVPRKHPERIRVMRKGLSWEEACRWEQFYIARYGRKDNETGILCNRTDGGEGLTGLVFTEEWRENIKKSRQLFVHKPEYREKQRRAHLGQEVPDHVKDANRARMLGRVWTQQELAKRSASRKTNEAAKREAKGITDEDRKAKKRKSAREWHRRQVIAKNGAVAADNAEKLAAAAAKFGVPVEVWTALSAPQRHRIRQRYAYGWASSRLLEGLSWQQVNESQNG